MAVTPCLAGLVLSGMAFAERCVDTIAFIIASVPTSTDGVIVNQAISEAEVLAAQH
ncbi:hypothetical protein [Desulfonatronum parangueonense]